MDAEDVAEQIVAAASKRFAHYGYGKTTMSEIAEDCNMSTGNLYRYFKSKLDIAQDYVRRIRREQMGHLREIARDAALKPGDKLRQFLQSKLSGAYERFHGNPKSFELALSIMNERPEFADDWEQAEGALIAEILSAGNMLGAYEVDDVVRMAKVVQDATFRFTSTHVFYEGELRELQEELDAIIDVLLAGLAAAAKSVAPT